MMYRKKLIENVSFDILYKETKIINKILLRKMINR